MANKPKIEPIMPPLALSIEQAALSMSVSVRTIYRLIEDGTIRPSKIGGRTVIAVTTLQGMLKAS